MNRRTPFPALLTSIFLAVVAVPAAAGGVPALLAPVNGAVIRGSNLLAVYTVPAGMKTAVRLDGEPWEGRRSPVPGNVEDLVHLRLSLEEGRHLVQVLEAETEAEVLRFSVTYVPAYSTRTAAGPKDLAYLFHTKDRERVCSGCHNLPEVFETLPSEPLSPAAKVCAACHPGIESAPNLHGPVAVYACFLCHEPQYTPSRFAQKGSEASGCGACHDDFLARVLGGKKHVHGPVAAGGCIVCHDPHGGYTNAVLRKTPPELCLLCHAPTLPLPVERGLHAKLKCVGCHDPHGGKTPLLTDREGNPFCRGCHRAVGGDDGGHPLAGHPVRAAVDPSNPSQPMGCRSCHDPHGTRDVSTQNIVENDDAQRRFCRTCHY